MPQIHPMAVVEAGARLADDVIIGPFAFVGAHVTLGAGCVVEHHASIEGHTTIGNANVFSPHAVIGGLPQDLKYRGGVCRVIIGNNNRFRECSTVHIGTEDGGGLTRIGDNNLFMVGAHIAHDCIVGTNCVFANNVMLAGHIIIGDYAVISGGAAITHFVTVGEHAFIGGISGVQRDIPPYMIANGHPAAIRGVNRTGLKRRGFTEEQLEALKTAYRMLFSDATPIATQAPELRRRFPDNAEIRNLLTFIENSNRGKHGRYRESLRGKVPAADDEENS